MTRASGSWWESWVRKEERQVRLANSGSAMGPGAKVRVRVSGVLGMRYWRSALLAEDQIQFVYRSFESWPFTAVQD